MDQDIDRFGRRRHQQILELAKSVGQQRAPNCKQKGKSNHAAIIFRFNGRELQVIAQGENHMRHRQHMSVHAERDVVEKWLRNPRTKKTGQRLYLLVLKVSNNGTNLSNSCCCHRCREFLMSVPCIHYVYYTMTNDTIIGNKPDKLPVYYSRHTRTCIKNIENKKLVKKKQK